MSNKYFLYIASSLNDNYKEKLLPPDIFNLTRLSGSDLSSKIYSFDTNQPSTSRAVKRKFIKDEPLSTESIHKRSNINQIMGDEKKFKQIPFDEN